MIKPGVLALGRTTTPVLAILAPLLAAACLLAEPRSVSAQDPAGVVPAGVDPATVERAPVASWLPLYTGPGLARLENENRITQLCADVEPADQGSCYESALATSIEVHTLHAAPDAASDRVGDLIVTATPGRGFSAFFRPADSDEPVGSMPDLYLRDWGYGPYYHQTITEQRGAWFRLPRGPWPDPIWIHRPDQLERWGVHEVGGGEILEMRGEGWVVLEVEADALVMRPEQEADLWCWAEDPPALEPVEPTRFTRAELVDADGHLRIRPKYMKGC